MDLPLHANKASFPASFDELEYSLVIHAYTLVIWGSVTLRGRDLTIVAHTIVCKVTQLLGVETGCLIDTSGANGSDASQNPPGTPETQPTGTGENGNGKNGVPGENGEPGKPGGNAGNVNLYAEKLQVIVQRFQEAWLLTGLFFCVVGVGTCVVGVSRSCMCPHVSRCLPFCRAGQLPVFRRPWTRWSWSARRRWGSRR